MGSRFPSTKVLDYCYHPVRLVIDDQVQYVPCGKCDGCLLHSANKWSMRLATEIEENQFSIFFTLTYSNYFLPTFVYSDTLSSVGNPNSFTCLHERNVRWNGKQVVRRVDDLEDIVLPSSFEGIQATNYQSDTLYFPYSSKRDVQLWLKLIRKDLLDLYEEGKFKEVGSKEELHFRYYLISEYGETLYRPHVHGVILPCNSEVADYLCYEGLFKNWKMCDKNMFAQHCHFADSGCAGYITQYLTMSSSLPQVYKERGIRPWRLSSKGAAIGYSHFDKAKVFEDVLSGVDTYSRNISRLDERYILRYPSDVGVRLFPKCFEYRKKDFYGLYRLYGMLWRIKRVTKWLEYSDRYYNRFLASFNPADVQAIKTCCKFCLEFGYHPFTYVYALDMYYYKQAMSALRYWYEWQEQQSDVYAIIKSYQNVFDYLIPLSNGRLGRFKYFVFNSFCNGFGLDATDLLFFRDVEKRLFSTVSEEYTSEVSDILANMVKMPKFNEKFGFSPNSECNF